MQPLAPMNKALFSLLLACLALTSVCPVQAQDAGQTPVAVISLVWGEVTVKHADADYKPARWLEPIFAGDQVRTAGAGSKLLITFFDDNHQEVLGPDQVGKVQAAGLSLVEGKGSIRKDKARNPFGAGGVENPFVYTHKLIQDDFKGADQGIEAEQATMRARVRPGFPPTFAWPEGAGETYQLSIVEPAAGKVVFSKELRDNRYQLSRAEANHLLKGVNYKWTVTSGERVVVRPYEFKLLTLPLQKWFDEQVNEFNDKREREQLQRSDWTDYLLVCSQVLEIDRAFEIAEKMKSMDPNNPRIYRALTRIYLYKKCPAHAQAAHAKLVELGGRDPINP